MHFSLEPCAPLNISVRVDWINGDEGFYISWTEIEDECKNGAIIGHILYLKRQFDNGTIKFLRNEYQNDSQAIDYEMADVHFGIRYLIAVAGITKAGVGHESPWANVTLGIIGIVLNARLFCFINFPIFFWQRIPLKF